jgi:DNA-directed RNA polymerase specialized sigma24 family protein
MAAEAFVLRFFEGKKNTEIAGILGTTASSVAVTLHRTRERLEREYRAELGGVS